MRHDDGQPMTLAAFDGLEPSQRKALQQVLVEQRFAPGAVVFAEGEPGRACGFLVSGAVHVEVRVGPAGGRERINTMGPGELFGEVALLDGGPRSASCVAGDAGAVVALLSRADFSQLFDAGSPFAFAMVRMVVRQLARRMQHAAAVWSDAARALESTTSGH